MSTVGTRRIGRGGNRPSLQDWCQKELSRLLKSPVDSEQVQYLLSIELHKDVQEYLEGLLGTENRAAQNFHREFFRRWRPPERQPDWPTTEEAEFLKPLVRAKDEEMVLFTSHKSMEPSKVVPPPGFSDSSITNGGNHAAKSVKKPPSSTASQPKALSREPSKQKSKFVPLLSAEGQSRTTVLLPGRHICQCLGQKHSLINNCVECGRIVCSQEGSGPCVFCDALVCTPEEEEVLRRDSKKAQKFKEKFLKQFQIREGERALEHIQSGSNSSDGLAKATQHKNKLLNFDQTSVKRTRVIDDESDHFSVDSNRWLTEEEKERLRIKEESLREQRHQSKRNKPISIDFAGRKIVENTEKVDVYDERHALEALRGNTETADIIQTHAGALYNLSIPIDPPQFQEVSNKKREGIRAKMAGKPRSVARIQDKTLQEMTDKGMCLSMHQPWASLLVAGIKTCEGRTWYSAHRGRLWIAATAKTPDQDEIRQLEQFYTAHHNDENLVFPSNYPSSCLLGCVDMVDCLPQEEYKEQFPGGESESSYVFVVENPRELVVKFPVKGQHKIWKLDITVHTGAKKGLK